MTAARQRRALKTREKILEALEHLLETREFELITIADLARQAGVAVGSVYSHFADRDALLPALLDRHLARTQARIAEARELETVDGVSLVPDHGESLRASIERSIRMGLVQVNSSLGVRRALLTYRRLHPHAELPLVGLLIDDALEELSKNLEPFRQGIVHEDLGQAARMVNYLINILFLDKIVFARSALQEKMRPPDDALISAYTTMIHSYLTRSDLDNTS